MNCFFSHNWVEVRREFNPPSKRGGNGLSEVLINKLAFGFTVIELKCQKCGDIKTIEFVGKSKGATSNN